ncbi:MAG TPA: hypothetical protein VGR53_11160 [Nitrososphaerales archaeon]|nr:hypothetical protein [Nitrososphaerales archaeon]
MLSTSNQRICFLNDARNPLHPTTTLRTIDLLALNVIGPTVEQLKTQKPHERRLRRLTNRSKPTAVMNALRMATATKHLPHPIRIILRWKPIGLDEPVNVPYTGA